MPAMKIEAKRKLPEKNIITARPQMLGGFKSEVQRSAGCCVRIWIAFEITVHANSPPLFSGAD